MSEDNKEPESPYWHGKEPFAKFVLAPWPWRPQGASAYNASVFAHRALFMDNAEPPPTALVKEGPKALMLVKK